MGALLLTVPNLLLFVLGFSYTADVWIRVLGLLAIDLGLVYAYCGRREQTEFSRATVWGRLLFFAGCWVLVALDYEFYMLGVVGCADLLGAAWTWQALRSEGKW